MKRILAITAALLTLSLGAGLVNAQTPNIQVYFDEGYGSQTRVCNVGNMEYAYVVAKNFNIWLVGVEYAVDYPPGITWMGDLDTPVTTIGSTPLLAGGISEVWQQPQNAFQPVKLARILYRCDQCNPDSPIVVTPHPISGFVRATRYPDLGYVYGVGLTSIFCPVTVPAENSTWGSVKALYGE